MAEVHRLPNAELPHDEPDETVVAWLEAALKKAKAGEIKGIAAEVFMANGGSVDCVRGNTIRVTELVAGATRLLFYIMAIDQAKSNNTPPPETYDLA